MPVIFADLCPGGCRMPLWPHRGQVRFSAKTWCGKRSVAGTSWCAEHLELVTNAGANLEPLFDLPKGKHKEKSAPALW